MCRKKGKTPICGICQKRGFTSESEVRKHIEAVHQLKCNICGLGGFYRPNNLKTHILDAHEGLGKDYSQRGKGLGKRTAEYSDANYDIFKTASKEGPTGLQENSYNIIF